MLTHQFGAKIHIIIEINDKLLVFFLCLLMFCVSIANLKGAFTKIFRKYALITLICGVVF